jgi:CBS domain-containing protein
MKVRQIMHKELVTVLPTATIHDAALKMKEQNVGSILIIDEGYLQGIVTDRDITLVVAADFKDPKTVKVSEIMKREIKTVKADDDIETALSIMSKENVRRLPVKENGKIVGLLSSADLATEIKEELNQFFGLEEAFAKH